MNVDGATACDGGWTHRVRLFGLFVSLLEFTLGPALLFTAHVQQAKSVARPAAYYVPMFRGVLTAGKVCNASSMIVVGQRLHWKLQLRRAEVGIRRSIERVM